MPEDIHLDASVINARFRELDFQTISISFVVEAELRVGMLKSHYPAQHRGLMTFIEAVRVAHSSPKVVLAYAHVRTSLERHGMKIGENDLWIAATALSEDATLVTHNVGEFSRVPSLRFENWP
jgi:tRNA(fMet)-specific endonuclease VapC